MDQTEMLEELKAQIEAHGVNRLMFLIDDEELEVVDVRFEDGLIKVSFE